MAISRKRITQCSNQVRPTNLFQQGDSANILEDVSLHSSIKGDNRAWKFHVKKIMLRLIQYRIKAYMKTEMPNFQAGDRKGQGMRYITLVAHCVIV